MNTKSKIATAAIAGIAAGSVLGVLFAPSKGKDTRKKLRDKSNEFAETAKSSFEKGKALLHLKGKCNDATIDKVEPISS
jgi:gas vesicle protein